MDDQLRIGDAEREHAAAELAEHYAQGRITADEHTERLDRIWAARTRAELAPVFRDLPGGTVPAATAVRRPAYRHAPRPLAGRGLPRPVVVLLVVLLVLALVTHKPLLLIGFVVLALVVRRRLSRQWSGRHDWTM